MTTLLHYMPQAHQTQQQMYTASNISESYQTLWTPSPMLLCHPCLPSWLMKTGECCRTVCKWTPIGWLCVAMLWYFPFSPCALPASVAIAPPTAKALPWRDPHCERSPVEETQKIRTVLLLCVFFSFPFHNFYKPSSHLYFSSLSISNQKDGCHDGMTGRGVRQLKFNLTLFITHASLYIFVSWNNLLRLISESSRVIFQSGFDHSLNNIILIQ
jgi:hypothetical protein